MPLTNPRQERNETGLTVRIFGDASDFNAAVREARDEVRKLNYELSEAVRLAGELKLPRREPTEAGA